MELERYIDELTKDVEVDEFALKECQMKLPALKHKWVGRLIRLKRDLHILQQKRYTLISAISDRVRESSEIRLTRPSADKIASKHKDIVEVDDEIKNIELIIELLDKSERIFSSMSFDLKNLVEIIKMETL